ncbi:SCP2 domain-containing protein [Uliginosibacterium sp. sgz301328]|uniref:ubiquinone anaerobic biosynthesis accessory factor UbiT n=1 Tax=Uliginosibacterium sp. sgz301328 TaxID=3243764 RepID=UPI00359D3E81
MHTESLRPAFSLPASLARIGRHLPRRPFGDALALALTVMRRTGNLPGDLDFLEGKTVCIKVSDLGIEARVQVNGERFRAAASSEADVSFQASSLDYARVALREEDPDTLFFQRRLRIEGDTELGLALKNLLDSIEPPAWLMRALAAIRPAQR